MVAQTNCTSILIAKLKKGTTYTDTYLGGSELPLADDLRSPDILEQVDEYDDYIYLNTVSKLKVSRIPIWDEGDSRIIYMDYLVEIEAVLHNDIEFGPLVDSLPNFNDKLEVISKFLDNQGLAINFIDHPSSIRRLLPTTEHKDTLLETYHGNTGWLVDTHNGPKPITHTQEMIAGNQAMQLTWSVKYRTAHTDIESQSPYLRPKISSELRLDIGHNGDLEFNVNGTIYGNSLAEVYAARDWLDIQYQPQSISGISNTHISQWEEDKWAMVNGFKKHVIFNVDNTGRAAKFQIKYTQIKSNNALPLGLTDIQFEQEIESTLLNGNALTGSAFRTWKDNFRAKITMPHRMSQHYCWYIVHALINQQLRRAEMVYASSVLDPDDPTKLKDGIATVGKQSSAVSKIVAKAFPLKIRIANKHFSRKLEFELDYLLLCPLSKIIDVSCILSRVNNDYARKVASPYNNYIPLPLSKQWYAWNKSTDLSQGFDPTQADAQNLGASNRPHRDSAGVEINDTGHNYDAYESLDDQERQRHILISTVFDPNEKDPDYELADPSDPSSSVEGGDSLYDTMTPWAHRLDSNFDEALNNFTQGNIPNAHATEANTERPATSNKPSKEVSWIEHKQSYEITETNPTIPTESLSEDVDKTDFTDQTQSDNLGIQPLSQEDIDYQELSEEINNLKLLEGVNLQGRIKDRHPDEELITDELDPNYNADLKVATRRTYATSPSRYYLTVRGHAIRMGYKIPIPTVMYIAGEKAIRVGNGRSKVVTIGADNDIPVYLAMWEQTYTVDKTFVAEDILSQIEDTGSSILFA